MKLFLVFLVVLLWVKIRRNILTLVNLVFLLKIKRFRGLEIFILKRWFRLLWVFIWSIVVY